MFFLVSGFLCFFSGCMIELPIAAMKPVMPGLLKAGKTLAF